MNFGSTTGKRRTPIERNLLFRPGRLIKYEWVTLLYLLLEPPLSPCIFIIPDIVSNASINKMTSNLKRNKNGQELEKTKMKINYYKSCARMLQNYVTKEIHYITVRSRQISLNPEVSIRPSTRRIF